MVIAALEREFVVAVVVGLEKQAFFGRNHDLFGVALLACRFKIVAFGEHIDAVSVLGCEEDDAHLDDAAIVYLGTDDKADVALKTLLELNGNGSAEESEFDVTANSRVLFKRVFLFHSDLGIKWIDS